MLSLWLPILVSTIAMFFFSYLSWEVLGLHDKDWRKMDDEDKLMDCIRDMNIAEGNYQLPGGDSAKEMHTPEYQEKYKKGPRAVMSVLPQMNIGKSLAMTALFFLACNITFAYLANFALKPGTDPGADFLTVFRFVATITLMTCCASSLLNSVWFRTRVVGHLIEAFCYCLIAGGIFAALWPV